MVARKPMKEEPDYSLLYTAISDESEADGSSPRVMGDFELLELIGEGGSGLVWKAREMTTGRIVALKHPRFSESSQTPEKAKQTARRFQKEVELVAQLEHPGIARLYGASVDETSGVPYFTMELVDGRPLNAEVKTPEESIALMIQLCSAVEHAHENGVIHRDLKPGNVFVSAEVGEPKVLDFGIGRALAESDLRWEEGTPSRAETLTLDGEVFGTLAYMAPEQALGDSRRCDTRTDVYALGAMLYEMITGQVPHLQEGGNLAVLRRIAEEEVKRPVNREGNRIDPDLEAILMKALSRSAKERYGSAGEFRRDLIRFSEGEPVTAQPLTASYLWKKNFRKHRSRWLLGFAGILFSVVLFGIWLQQRRGFLAEQVRLRENAEVKEQEARDERIRALTENASERLRRGLESEAIALLARACRISPEDRTARALLSMTVRQLPILRRAGDTFRFPGLCEHIAFSSDGDWAALAVSGNEVGIWILDGELQEVLHTIPGRWNSRAMVVSPDGKCMAAILSDRGSEDPNSPSCYLFLFDQSGVLSQTKLTDGAPAAELFWSPDSQTLAVSGNAVDEQDSKYGYLSLWDVSDQRNPVRTHSHKELNRPGLPIGMFSLDGESFYFRRQEQDGRVWRWDISRDTIERTPIRQGPESGRPYHVNYFVYDQEGNFYVSGQGEFVAKWVAGAEGFEREWTTRVPAVSAISDLTLSKEGSLLAGVSLDSRILIFQSETGEMLAEIQEGERVEEVEFTPDSHILVSRTISGQLSVWDWEKLERIASPLSGGQEVRSFDISPDGKQVVVGKLEHARVWELEPINWKPTVVELGSPLRSLEFTRNGLEFIAASSEGDKAFHVDALTGDILATWPHRSRFRHHRADHWFAPAVSRNQRICVTADSTHKLVVRDLFETSKPPLHLRFEDEITAIELAENSSYFAVGDRTHTARVFDLSQPGNLPEPISILKGKGMPQYEMKDWKMLYPEADEILDNFVLQLAFANGGQRLAMVEFPQPIVTSWNVSTEHETFGREVLDHDTVVDLFYSPSGEHLYFGGHGRCINRVDTSSGNLRGRQLFHQDRISRIVMTKSGERLVSSSSDGEVCVWDATIHGRLRPLNSFKIGRDPIRDIALSHDGFLCAVTGDNGAIYLWMIERGIPLGKPLVTDSPIRALSFHPSSMWLGAACENGKVFLWQIPTGIGVPRTSFIDLCENLGGWVMAPNGRIVPGGRYFFGTSKKAIQEHHARHLKEHRDINSNFYPSEYFRYAYEVHGLPAPPFPDWMKRKTAPDAEGNGGQ